jgi:hypothetical protein
VRGKSSLHVDEHGRIGLVAVFRASELIRNLAAVEIAERRRNNSRDEGVLATFVLEKKSRPLRGEALSGLVGEVLRGGG